MRVAIIGGGAAGLMAAYFAAQNKKAKVTLFEQNEKLGKKIYITGKGRCNISNTASREPYEFLKNVVNNNKFLYSAINNFTYYDLCDFCEQFGLKLNVERGGRVFPASNKSSDVIKMLEIACTKSGVNIKLNSKVLKLEKLDDGDIEVEFKNQVMDFDSVIICTGGFSYRATGSDGDGYKFAKSFSINVVNPKPALVPIALKENVASLEGLSLKNVQLTSKLDGKIIKSFFGEMLFTKDGISGPIALSMSSFVNNLQIDKLKFEIDLKPSVSFSELENRFLKDVSNSPNINFKNLLKDYLPKSLIDYFIQEVKIPADKKLNSITTVERKQFINTLKCLQFSGKKLYDVDMGIITSGGVNVNEINPSTMESKKVKGLYFAGEVLDVDALTGGFNLHLAFATGKLAGMNASKYKE